MIASTTKQRGFSRFQGASLSSTSSDATSRSMHRISSLKKSSSSLCLHELSASSLRSSENMTDTSEGLSSFLSHASTSDEPPLSIPPVLDAENQTLVQYVLIIAIVLQIPNYVKEIIEILDLHIHFLPLLVVFGSLPAFLKIRWRISLTMGVSGKSPLPPMLSASYESKHSSLAGIEEYYRRFQDVDSHGSLSPEDRRKPLSHADEWGHFADLDDSGVHDKDILFNIPLVKRLSSAASSIALESLKEVDEDSTSLEHEVPALDSIGPKLGLQSSPSL